MRSILLVGDSFAVGLAPKLQALATAANTTFDVAAKTGTRIAQWLTDPKLLASLDVKLAQRPGLVLVSLGTNDEKLSAAQAQKELPALDALLTRIRAAGSDVAWISPPSLPFAGNGITATIRSRVRTWIDALPLPRGKDGLHPTGEGYVIWAERVWNAVQSRQRAKLAMIVGGVVLGVVVLAVMMAGTRRRD